MSQDFRPYYLPLIKGYTGLANFFELAQLYSIPNISQCPHSHGMWGYDIRVTVDFVISLQGWALRSFPFGTLRSFPFLKKNVPFFSRVFGDL